MQVKESLDGKSIIVMSYTDTDAVAVDFKNADFEAFEFEILRVGEFFDQRYGKFEVTEDRLHILKRNFDDNVLDIDVALDLNHDPSKGAFAWIKELSVRGGKLFARFKDFTEEGKKIFREKAFKYFSVEFAPFTKVENGKKVTINDVLRGVALTNRPVIKGMSPTFLSENVSLSFNPVDMKIFRIYAESLEKKDAVTPDEFSTLKGMHSELSEEQQKEFATLLEEVEEKVKEETPAPETPAPEKKEAEKEAEKPAEVTAAELSETNKKLDDANKEIDVLKASEKKRVVEDNVKSLMLSEADKPGFVADSKSNLEKFVATLSDKQFTQFQVLLGEVRIADKSMFDELGHGKTGVDATSDEAKHEKVKTLAEEIRKDKGVPLHEAAREAQKQVFGT